MLFLSSFFSARVSIRQTHAAIAQSRQNNLVRPFWTRASADRCNDWSRRAPVVPVRTRVGSADSREIHALRPRVQFSLFPLLHRPPFSTDSSVSLSPPSLSFSFSLCHRFPRITFHGQFNRSCAAGCAKWSCVLGDKWDTSFLDRASLRGRVYSFASARDPAEPADWIGWGRYPMTGSVRVIRIYWGLRVLSRSCGAAASYRGTQSVAATAWNYNGCGVVTTVGCIRCYQWSTLPLV